MKTTSETRLNDKGWKKIAEDSDLLSAVSEQGYRIISAREIHRLSGREPRLMAKMDFELQRPGVFREHQLNILPLQRGNYLVFRDVANTCYIDLPGDYEERRPLSHSSELDLSTLQTLAAAAAKPTETDIIDVAYLSSMLARFTGVKGAVLTKRGKFGSSSFQIKLPGTERFVTVERSQIEVDSIYEASDAVILIEAKTSFPETFHLRQLYYPYRWLQDKTNKRIVCVLLCFSNGKFQLTEFEMTAEFRNCRILRQEYFVLDKYATARIDLGVIFGHNRAREDRSIPFPQADDMDKVIDVVLRADDGMASNGELIDAFGFDIRQAHYYVTAARYLGFIDKDRTTTRAGRDLIRNIHPAARSGAIVAAMAKRPVPREALKLLQARGFDPQAVTKEEVKSLIEYQRSDVTKSTIGRRADSIRNWLRWAAANCQFE